MKTPKEKAVELIDKFKDYARHYSDELTTAEQEQVWAIETAKQIAMVYVDEMIEFCESLKSEDCSISFVSKKINYWQEVKLELEQI